MRLLWWERHERRPIRRSDRHICVNNAPIGIVEAGQYWHTDTSYSPSPPAYACLFAVEIPHDAAGAPLGGTIFVSTAHTAAQRDLRLL